LNSQVNVLLLLLQIIYGSKQAARVFWQQITIELKDMEYQQLMEDPCLWYSWKMTQLSTWLTWIDDFIAGNQDGV